MRNGRLAGETSVALEDYVDEIGRACGAGWPPTRPPRRRRSRSSNLRWLMETIGDELLDAIVITTGETAYRRADGIGVVPAALLGP